MFPSPHPLAPRVERLLADFARKDKPTVADFAALRCFGKLYDALDRYRAKAQEMSVPELRGEKHRSRRLGLNLARCGDPRPSPRCDAHAIVSGQHSASIQARGVLAWLKLRIDDPHNGCWLPRDWEDRWHMPPYLRNGVPHRRIHHEGYYGWLNQMIHPLLIKTPEQLIQALRMIRTMLQEGNVPPSVMPQTGR
ncbi:AHH domain-containing protein [Microbulbifer thermotolerans]|uniref:AHH domain-containing protein n=1 Tax=Microbulbifer thermotolerans TaxID=252514 RepID=UPI00267335F8|nr:AHH domain-containing protein [Microbulbifer thermotolerans]WKT59315.1 AHH domain-containing protein [Microbulbifer thermotolerans]